MSLPSRSVRHRTRAGRLAVLDAWLCAEASALLDGRGAVLDVGYGLEPITTLELARAVRAVTPGLRVVGLERAQREAVRDELELRGLNVERAPREVALRPGGHELELRILNVERASPEAAPDAGPDELELHAGDFGTCATLAPLAVVRAMNVLRGYREAEVPALHAALGAGLVEGGLVLEGSCDTDGTVTVVHLLRRRGAGLVREALLFHTDGSRGFSPWLFRDWLPRDLRRRAHPGTPVHALLEAWAARAVGDEPRARFLAALESVPDLEATDWERAHGYARWVPRAGVPLVVAPVS